MGPDGKGKRKPFSAKPGGGMEIKFAVKAGKVPAVKKDNQRSFRGIFL